MAGPALAGLGRCAWLLALVQPCLWQESKLCRGSRLKMMPQLQFRDAFWVSGDGWGMEQVEGALGGTSLADISAWLPMRVQLPERGLLIKVAVDFWSSLLWR